MAREHPRLECGLVRFDVEAPFRLRREPPPLPAPTPRTYPRGRVSFEGEVMTIEVFGDMVPAECRHATFQVQVVRLGATPVALFCLPIADACAGRLADMRVPLIYAPD